MLQIRDQIISTLKDIKAKKSRLKMAPAIEMLKLIIQKGSVSFICIDALDELETANRRQLLESLKSILRLGTTKIFLTGRQHIRNEVNSCFQREQICEIQLVANPDDIQRYVNNKIEQDARFKKDAMNNELKKQILTSIITRSQGM